MKKLSTISLTISVLFLPLLTIGCRAAPHEAEFKLNSLRSSIGKMAGDLVREKKEACNEVVELDYWVSVNPEFPSDCVETGEGGENVLGSGVPGSLGIIYSESALDAANTAVLSGVALLKNGKIDTTFEAWVWTEKQWKKASTIGDEELKRLIHDQLNH